MVDTSFSSCQMLPAITKTLIFFEFQATAFLQFVDYRTQALFKVIKVLFLVEKASLLGR